MTFMASMAMMLFATNAQAQFLYDNLYTIEQKGWKTISVLDYKSKPNYYEGTELVAGVIHPLITIIYDNEDGIDFELPANDVMDISLLDPYGRNPFQWPIVNRLGCLSPARIQYTDYMTEVPDEGHLVTRGGQYTYRCSIPGLEYIYEEPLVLKDEPSVRLQFENMRAGQDLKVRAVYNSGYPYDPSQFTGNEKAEMRLFALGQDDQGNMTETELAMAQKPLRLNRTDQPLVAAIDNLVLSYAEAEPGLYRLKLSSDWKQEGANADDIIIGVQDTLTAEAKLAKARYEVGVDNGLKVHLKMHYGYPYIQADKEGGIPTVNVKTLVLTIPDADSDQRPDTLVNMTTPIADAALAEKALDWEDDIVTPALEAQKAAPKTKANLEAKIIVTFNGGQQYSASIPFNYVPATSTAIKRMENQPDAQASESDIWYTLQGVKVAEGANAPKGIYVRNGQKVAK